MFKLGGPPRGASVAPGAGSFGDAGMPDLDAVPIEDLSTAEAMDAALGPASGGPLDGGPARDGRADDAPTSGASGAEDTAFQNPAPPDPARGASAPEGGDETPKPTPPHIPPTGDT